MTPAALGISVIVSSGIRLGLPIRHNLALAHIGGSYYYGAYCRKCKHSARLSLVKLRAHLGDDFPLAKVKERLRCERCSSRQVVITFLAPNQRTGNVAYLFAEEPTR